MTSYQKYMAELRIYEEFEDWLSLKIKSDRKDDYDPKKTLEDIEYAITKIKAKLYDIYVNK